ncbi:MAG: hypothetical protein M3014_11090, partial [Chloroflexota bacterium]|nr:hypothetical protein [Chloroflexota bacterium]
MQGNEELARTRARGRNLRPIIVMLMLMLIGVASLSAGAAFAGLPAAKNAAPLTQSKQSKTMEQNSSGVPQLQPQLQGQGGGGTSAPLAPPAAPNLILYDQYNNAGANATVSQQFEPANVTFNAQGGDDFAVPAGQNWSVTEVDAQGQYFNGPGPATSFNIYFYNNSGTLPAAPVYTATAQTFTGGPTNFVISLTTPALLSGGQSYWISVQAVMNFTPSGEWGWQDRTVVATNPSAWRNPGGGLGTTCANWGVKTTCIPTSQGDFVYRLVGTAPVQGTPTATATVQVGTATRTQTPGGPTSTVGATATCVPQGAGWSAGPP